MVSFGKCRMLCSAAEAIDIIYEKLDTLLLTSQFEEAAILMRALAQKKLPLAILRSALTISFPWRSQLGDALSCLSRLENLEAEDYENMYGDCRRFSDWW